MLANILNIKEPNKENIANMAFNVNALRIDCICFLEKNEIVINNANQPADRFIKRSANVLNIII